MPLVASEKAALAAKVAALSVQINALVADAAPPSPPPPPPPPPNAPRLLYTDCPTGPVGGVLSLFGVFGDTATVSLGATSCQVLERGPSKVAGKLPIKMLRVKIPSVAPGAYALTVIDGGVASVAQSLIVTAGRVLHVALTGNDATAAINDPAKPWRNLQTAVRGGAYATLRAGDQIIIHGGNWTDTGFDTAWLRFRDAAQQGTPTAWVHITGAPGEDVHYSTPAAKKGGIHGANSAYAGLTGDYVAVSCLRMDMSATAQSDAAPINTQYSVSGWWAVNNELGPWPGTAANKAAGVSGAVNGGRVLGNHVHDIAGGSNLENHGVYVDAPCDGFEVAYNWIHDITGGSLLQWYESRGGSPCFVNQSCHHNWAENSGKHGLNLTQGLVSGHWWGNVIIGAKNAALRVSIEGGSQNMAVAIDGNVFHDNDRTASGSSGQMVVDWGNYGPTGTVAVANNDFAAGPLTVASDVTYLFSGDSDAYMALSGNRYWANGHAWTKPSKDAAGTLYTGPIPPALIAVVI
jgi:hypothetical protein